jgi:metal-responsive CopG/Arc/MetJ family transcriptional regulator
MMQQFTIRMPEEYFAKIEKIAESTGLKKSDITRIALKKYLEEYSQNENTNLFRKAKRLIGVVESGVPDLGQNHRRHLIEKIKGLN